MKVQILLGNQLIDTQIVSTEMLAAKPSLADVKRLALKASLEDRKIKISESLQANFRIFDVNGQLLGD